jgi:hypothetical protein
MERHGTLGEDAPGESRGNPPLARRLGGRRYGEFTLYSHIPTVNSRGIEVISAVKKPSEARRDGVTPPRSD